MCGRINARGAHLQEGSGGMTPRKIFRFSVLLRSFLVHFRRIDHKLCKPLVSRPSVCDIDYCDCECEVQGFPPRSLGECKVLRMGTACREDSGATP